jgi:hypothetical protein
MATHELNFLINTHRDYAPKTPPKSSGACLKQAGNP